MMIKDFNYLYSLMMKTIPTQTIAQATVYPETQLAVLSAAEVNDLCAAQNHTIYGLFHVDIYPGV